MIDTIIGSDKEGIKIITVVLMVLILLFSVFYSTPQLYQEDRQTYAYSGAGSEDEPHIITDIHGLQAAKDDLSGHYVLYNDIDATETRYWNEGEGFEPIGTEEVPFEGTFDGRGHDIHGLYINRSTDDVGLFGYLGIDGTITNVSVTNAEVTGGRNTAILLGTNRGNVTYASASGRVDGENRVGGLVGYILYSSLSHTWADATVKGEELVGGLAGYSLYGEIYKSYSSGDVHGEEKVGGLVGYQTGVGFIDKSYATGEVSGEYFVGGLLGSSRNRVFRSYALGDVRGIDFVGGLVGQKEGSWVIESYAAGSVKGEGSVGGLIGDNSGTIESSFWDMESTGQVESRGGVGKNTTEMMDLNTFIADDWNITEVEDENSRDTGYAWNIVNNRTYPFLSWEETRYPTETSRGLPFWMIPLFGSIASAILVSLLLYKKDREYSKRKL